MGLSLSSVSDATSCIGKASEIDFSSYLLSPTSPVQRALLAAAHRGAHVSVTLPIAPFHYERGALANIAAAHALENAHAHVTLVDQTNMRFHLKATVCDGVAYLDGVNWTSRGSEVIVKDDDPHDVTRIRRALHGDGVRSTRALAMHKIDALEREATLIRSAGNAPVIVESEFAGRSDVMEALRKHAARHAPTTLILGRDRTHRPWEDRMIRSLRAAGVDVRERGNNQKLALVGNRAWIGSANATASDAKDARQLEWSVVTRDPRLVSAVREALRRDGAGDALPRG